MKESCFKATQQKRLQIFRATSPFVQSNAANQSNINTNHSIPNRSSHQVHINRIPFQLSIYSKFQTYLSALDALRKKSLLATAPLNLFPNTYIGIARLANTKFRIANV